MPRLVTIDDTEAASGSDDGARQCLAIPGQVIELVDEANRLAQVDVAGVRRNVNVGLLDGDDGGAKPGDWVLIHVGFALSKVDEEEAHATLRPAAADGRRVRAGARGPEGERRSSDRRLRRRATASPAPTRACRCGSSRCAAGSTALCEGDVEVMTDLVGAVEPGDELLVHAGVALARLGVRYVDEFRDAELGRALATEIVATVEPGRHYKVMEVCGGHTHTIYKYGVDDLLPENVELVHGPGCPVCVIPMGRVDDGIAVAAAGAA